MVDGKEERSMEKLYEICWKIQEVLGLFLVRILFLSKVVRGINTNDDYRRNRISFIPNSKRWLYNYAAANTLIKFIVLCSKLNDISCPSTFWLFWYITILTACRGHQNFCHYASFLATWHPAIREDFIKDIR